MITNKITPEEETPKFTLGPWEALQGDRCWHVRSADRTFETGCIMFAEIAQRASTWYCADYPSACVVTRPDMPHCISCLSRAALSLVDAPKTKETK